MVVGINDGGALGAYQAVVAAGKDDPSSFFVGGIDATPEALAAIKEGGAYQATVDQQPKEMGALCVRTLVAAIVGQPYEPINAIQLAPVNATNVDEFMD
jgi:ribose transport system substrate-binding protein